MLLLDALLADRRQLDLSFEATKLASQVSEERLVTYKYMPGP